MLSLASTTIRQLDEAIDANLVANVSWVPSRMAQARVLDSPTFVLVDSGYATDTLNVVCRARLGRDLAASISSAIKFFGDRAHPFAWWVGPLDEPADLGRALSQAG